MFREILSDFKEYWVWLQNWLFYRRHALKMNLAIRLADMKQRAFNKQYHVMLLEVPTKVSGRITYSDKLVSVNRDEINKFKRKKWLPKNIGMLEMRDSFFYSTPLNRNNKSTPGERRKAREKYLKYAKRYMQK